MGKNTRGGKKETNDREEEASDGEEEATGYMWPCDYPDEDRQIYAAWADVPVETCKKCPYFRPAQTGSDIWDRGQHGFCGYKRTETETYNMSGEALCDTQQSREKLLEEIENYKNDG